MSNAAKLPVEPFELLPDAIYGMSDISRWLGYRPDYLADGARKKLMERAGFPRPISKVGRPRWRGATILAWAAEAHDAPKKTRGAVDNAAAGNVLDLRTEAMKLEGRGRRKAQSAQR